MVASSEGRAGLREAVRRRARALAAFGRWERAQGPPERSAESVFAGLGTLYDLLPPDVRARDDDPERLGVRRMHAMLAVLGKGPAR